jgi:hypothetical protein
VTAQSLTAGSYDDAVIQRCLDNAACFCGVYGVHYIVSALSQSSLTSEDSLMSVCQRGLLSLGPVMSVHYYVLSSCVLDVCDCSVVC